MLVFMYVCVHIYIYIYILITRIYIPTITYLLPLNIWANCSCANNYWAIYVLFLGQNGPLALSLEIIGSETLFRK